MLTSLTRLAGRSVSTRNFSESCRTPSRSAGDRASGHAGCRAWGCGPEQPRSFTRQASGARRLIRSRLGAEIAAINLLQKDGRARAKQLGNRGPVRFDADSNLALDILEAYQRCGFDVFTDVLADNEVADLRAEFDEVLDNAPLTKDGQVDQHGRPVRFPGYYSMSSDALFGQNGADDANSAPVIGLVSHPLLMMDSALRVYGHPSIMKMAEAVNGPDFVPFHESIFHKGAGEGPPTPWHQDGRTHWVDNGEALLQPDGSGHSHGFNLNVSWSTCTPENGLWVVPGSQRQWRLADGGSNSRKITYSEDYVLRRTRMIPLAINARQQRFIDEEPYEYHGSLIGDTNWSDDTRAEISQLGDEYWWRDITL